MTTYQAKVININEPIVIQMSNTAINLNFKKDTAFIKNDSFSIGHKVIISKDNNLNFNKNKKIIYDLCDDFFQNVSNNDIMQIQPDGHISLLWEKRINPHDVSLFITNQCNANCIMCPQPPKKDEYSLLNFNKKILTFLKNEPIVKIGITGGEPTLKPKDLEELLSLAYKNYPNAKIDLLTNGKKLADFNFSKKIALSNPNINFCISFPSDNEKDFNKIINTKIYTDVLKAVQNLAVLRQNIELRIVVSNLNYKRLLQISEFIYRNFPFVYHITFMGMEVVGHAYDNYEELNINPKDYEENLIEAITFLHRRNMNVSIYNIPFCLVNEKLWKFLRNSISAWKQNYQDECNLCSKKGSCPGIFSTSKIKYELKAIY